MKQIGFLILTIIFSLTGVQAQTKKAKQEMAFDKTVDGATFHDYGSVVYGANGEVEFLYTNKGTVPLVISDVKSTCGCTIPSWTKAPVAPGTKGSIKVKYNTTLPGVFNKTIEVFSNANNSPVRITLKGKINAQATDLKPGKMDKQVKQEGSVPIDGQQAPIVSKKSSSKPAEPGSPEAIRAEKLESLKKNAERQDVEQKTESPVTGMPVQQPAAPPVKKK
jgi:hypothetical protein